MLSCFICGGNFVPRAVASASCLEGPRQQSQIESPTRLAARNQRGMDQTPPPCCVGSVPLHHMPVCPWALALQPRKVRTNFASSQQAPMCRGAPGRATKFGRQGARTKMSSLRGRPDHSCWDAVAASCGQFARAARGVNLRSIAGSCASVLFPQLTFH